MAEVSCIPMYVYVAPPSGLGITDVILPTHQCMFVY